MIVASLPLDHRRGPSESSPRLSVSISQMNFDIDRFHIHCHPTGCKPRL